MRAARRGFHLRRAEAPEVVREALGADPSLGAAAGRHGRRAEATTLRPGVRAAWTSADVLVRARWAEPSAPR